VRGKSGNSPFLPGGLDDIVNSGSVEWENSAGISGKSDEHQRLLTVAPGLSRGLRLPGEVNAGEESVEGVDMNKYVYPSDTLNAARHFTTDVVCFLLQCHWQQLHLYILICVRAAGTHIYS
jgi:Ski2 N-terminal region